jgi:ribosomal protein S12 methylthiotransferase
VDDETGMYLLRTKADCPEIDGNVLTPADTPLETGAFAFIIITTFLLISM